MWLSLRIFQLKFAKCWTNITGFIKYLIFIFDRNISVNFSSTTRKTRSANACWNQSKSKVKSKHSLKWRTIIFEVLSTANSTVIPISLLTPKEPWIKCIAFNRTVKFEDYFRRNLSGHLNAFNISTLLPNSLGQFKWNANICKMTNMPLKSAERRHRKRRLQRIFIQIITIIWLWFCGLSRMNRKRAEVCLTMVLNGPLKVQQ